MLKKTNTIKLPTSLIQQSLKLSPKQFHNVFKGKRAIQASILDKHTIQYQNLIMKGDFLTDEVFEPNTYDIIDIPNETLSRKEEAHNLILANYGEIIESGVDLIQKIKSKLLKGIHISSVRLQNVSADKVDNNGNLLNGSVEFVLTAANYSNATSIPMYVTLYASDGILEVKELFKDNLGRVYSLNTSTVERLLS